MATDHNPHLYSDPKLYARVEVLEQGVQHIAASVDSLSKSFARFVDKQNDRPVPIPFKEIIVTAGACFGLLLGISNWVDARISAQLAKPVYQIEQLQKSK